MIETSFTAHLRRLADPIWQAQHDHPLVQGIGTGQLPTELFGYWLRQDYLFLIDYARFFGQAVLRAPDLAAMTKLAQLLHEVLYREMELHRSYAAEFGISEADLVTETKAPTTQGYTDFLLRTASTGEYAEILGALLPCMWGYSEVGQRLAAGIVAIDPRYRRWINVYADPEFAELARWCRDLTDSACTGLPAAALARVEDAFITSSRYELAFWEMAWTGETWAV
ncbi:MAG: thiaminase II [Thermomicrobiales bacterium]